MCTINTRHLLPKIRTYTRFVLVTHIFFVVSISKKVCPKGGRCPGGYRVWPDAGYYRKGNESSLLVYACNSPETERCLGAHVHIYIIRFLSNHTHTRRERYIHTFIESHTQVGHCRNAGKDMMANFAWIVPPHITSMLGVDVHHVCIYDKRGCY